MDWLQQLMPAFDRCDNSVWIGFPDEWHWLLIERGDKAMDGRLEIDDGVKGAKF